MRRHPSTYIAKARARRAEQASQADSAAMRAAGRCECALRHLPGADRCAPCREADARKARVIFAAL